MQNKQCRSQGFTLIASLLLLILLSGFAIGLLMMVNTEQRSGGNDLNNNYTYHVAEGAIEKMTSDLGSTFKAIQSPSVTDICNLSNNYPTWDTTVTYVKYNVAPQAGCSQPLTTQYGSIQSGSDAGLSALIIPVTMNVEVQRLTGATVSMTRTAQVALIPVFQFGIFSDSDLFFGRSPNLGFGGRIHTNGDLYLGVSDTANLVFGDKMSAYGNVIRTVMDNNVPASGNDDNGPVLIPTTSGGCSIQLQSISTGATPVASSTCKAIAATDGSVVAAHGSSQNTSTWQNVSLGTYGGYLIDGNVQANGQPGPNSTGASDLTLPFVAGTSTTSGSQLQAFQIIRRPLTTTLPTSLLGASQLGYTSQIRVLLSDTQAGLHLYDWNGNSAQDYQLVGVLPTALSGLNQGATGGGKQAGAVQVIGPSGTTGHYYYFGESYCAGSSVIGSGYSTGSACPGDNHFLIPPYYGPTYPWSAITNFPAPTSSNFSTANGGTNGLEWPIINGWLLVEAKWTSDGKWHGVTSEWLGMGFARGLNVPTQPGVNPTTGTACTSPANTLNASGCNALADHANAILYFQVTADRGGDGTSTGSTDLPLTSASTCLYCDTINTSYQSQYNWYPINLYDAREGEVNDVTQTAATGTPNGVMNAVELDVGNLKNWLLGRTGTTGTKVDSVTQNGYILYFSDRRGMQFAANPYQWGEYGYEDTVNYSNAANSFKPDGVLDPVNYNGIQSAEDVNGSGALDVYGVKGVGDAFGYKTDTDTTVPASPYAHRLSTWTIGRANRVTGARHVLKLVDGSLGNLPTMPPSSGCSYTDSNGNPSPTGCGGFTVGSENPVYIQGNYNSNCPVAGLNCTLNNSTYDQTWTSTTAPEPNHAAAAIIADAVTMLSNNWQDAGCTPASGNCASSNSFGSLLNPTNPGGQGVPAQTPNRIATTSYYRVAIAAGKTIAFSNVAQNPEFAYGSDGGLHNFLRFLEDWGGPASTGAQQSLYYKGSIVSLYWDTYATGAFKCCGTVYNPPNREYGFDSLFTKPQNLPPGTPMFRNVNNLSYRQNQVAETTTVH